MCGIAGIFDPRGAVVETRRIEAMINVLEHRGPDDGDCFTTSGIGLGSRRLSILDPSPRGRMPMVDETTGNQIVHNGEIYNYKEIARDLNISNLKTGTDTEVILQAYAREGISCVKRFNGIFAFAIWDAKEEKLICARDQLGVKPFFYSWHNNQLLFASEVKALLSVGVPVKADHSIIRDYLVHGVYDHSNKTFFDGIIQLPAGSILIAKKNKVETQVYWSLDLDKENEISQYENKQNLDDACTEFREVALDSIRLQLRSDVPIAVHVSGGLDSAFLMASLNLINGGQANVKAYSYIYGEDKYDERPQVEILAKQLGWNVEFKKLTAAEVPSLAEEAMWYQEQPYPGIVTLAKHNLIKETREAGAKVIIEGQGGDEIGAGYQYYMGPHVLDLIEAGNSNGAFEEINGFAKLNNYSQEKGFIKNLDSQAAYFRMGRSADGSSFLNNDCLDEAFINKYKTSPQFNKPFKSNLLNMQYRDILHTKLPRILRSCDRASMAYSRELRVPFLDHRLVELVFSLPGRFKINKGAQRVFMRRALNSFLPHSLSEIPKRAVVDPQRDWLKYELREWVEDILFSKSFSQRGLFNTQAVKREYHKYVNTPSPENSFYIWQWVCIEQWYRTFLDGVNVNKIN